MIALKDNVRGSLSESAPTLCALLVESTRTCARRIHINYVFKRSIILCRYFDPDDLDPDNS